MYFDGYVALGISWLVSAGYAWLVVRLWKERQAGESARVTRDRALERAEVLQQEVKWLRSLCEKLTDVQDARDRPTELFRAGS